jgi:hypothetical protein
MYRLYLQVPESVKRSPHSVSNEQVAIATHAEADRLSDSLLPQQLAASSSGLLHACIKR